MRQNSRCITHVLASLAAFSFALLAFNASSAASVPAGILFLDVALEAACLAEPAAILPFIIAGFFVSKNILAGPMCTSLLFLFNPGPLETWEDGEIEVDAKL